LFGGALSGSITSLDEHRQQNPGKHRDDCHDDKQFNQCESTMSGGTCRPGCALSDAHGHSHARYTSEKVEVTIKYSQPFDNRDMARLRCK
jgi:hypothetical protein